MIPYHWIKNIGLALLVLLQMATMMIALSQINSDQRTVSQMNNELTKRFEVLGRLERSSHAAYSLFVYDTTDSFVTIDSFNDILQATLSYTDSTATQTNDAALKDRLFKFEYHLQRMLSALPLYADARQQFDSDTALFEDLIEEDFSQLFQLQMERLTTEFQTQTVTTTDQLQILDELTQAAEEIFKQLKTSPIHQPQVIIALLNDLEVAMNQLEENRFPLCLADDPSCQQICIVRDNINRLRNNLPGIYKLWHYDPNLSYLNDEVNELNNAWDGIQIALNVLLQIEQHQLNLDTQQLSHVAEVGKIKFTFVALLSLATAFAFTLLLSRILHSRLNRVVIGIQQYTQGNYNYRLDDNGRDHLAALACEFNGMANNLGTKQRQLRQAHDELEQRVVERTQELQQVNDRLLLMDQVFKNAREAILVMDEQGKILRVNPEFERLTGFRSAEISGRRPALLHEVMQTTSTPHLLPTDASLWEGEVTLTDIAQRAIPTWVTISCFESQSGTANGYIAMFHDLRKIKEQEQQIRHQALHDALTGLPNRVLMADRLGVAMAQAKRTGRKVGVLFLDLDNFKTINDSLGHTMGDKLLVAIAKLLVDNFRDEDTVCRLGGDEFIIILGNITETRSIYDLAERLLVRLTTPLQVAEHKLRASTSIGVAIYPDNGSSINELLKNADMAMYAAKEKGKNTLSTFSTTMDQALQQRLAMEDAIRAALEHKQFEVYYQPQISTDGQRLLGAEALVRWNDPERGLIPPNQFIPLCEETGLILALGEQVLRSTFNYASRFCQQPGFENCRFAVNVSPRQFSDPKFLDIVQSALNDSQVRADNIEIEITESSMMKDVERTRQVLNQLQQTGISIAIDDFGTGYSSLTQLKHFPIQTLKIDRSFIRDIPEDEEDKRLVETIIAMAHHMRIDLVAEGVETTAQQQFLANLGCQKLQGFLYSPPLPTLEFEQFCQQLSQRAAKALSDRDPSV